MSKLRMSQQESQPVNTGKTYIHEWFCENEVEKDGVKQACGARLKLTGDKERDEGKSNFVGFYPPNFPEIRLRGHSVVPSGMLNWNGLAEERGWIVTPKVICPACQVGETLEEYLRKKRT